MDANHPDLVSSFLQIGISGAMNVWFMTKLAKFLQRSDRILTALAVKNGIEIEKDGES